MIRSTTMWSTECFLMRRWDVELQHYQIKTTKTTCGNRIRRFLTECSAVAGGHCGTPCEVPVCHCLLVLFMEDNNSISYSEWLDNTLPAQTQDRITSGKQWFTITAYSFMKKHVLSVLWLHWFKSRLTQQHEVSIVLIKGFSRADRVLHWASLNPSQFCQPVTHICSVCVCQGF